MDAYTAPSTVAVSGKYMGPGRHVIAEGYKLSNGYTNLNTIP